MLYFVHLCTCRYSVIAQGFIELSQRDEGIWERMWLSVYCDMALSY